jgi:hypothetical protein
MCVTDEGAQRCGALLPIHILMLSDFKVLMARNRITRQYQSFQIAKKKSEGNWTHLSLLQNVL